MWFFWGSNTLGKHQLKDLGKLAHKTWTAWAVLHVACRMSTRLLRNIPVFFAFRNSNSWLNALEIRLNTHTQNNLKHRRKLATQQMGRPRKRCEGHATHKNRRMKKWKNSWAVTGGMTLFFQWLCVCVCIESVASQEALQSHLILPISIDLSWVDELWITQFCVFLFGNHFNGYRTRGRYNRDIQQASKVPKLPIQNVSIPNCEGEYCTNFKTFKRSFEGLGNYFSYNSCHVQVQNHLFLQADLYFFSVHTAHPWYLIQNILLNYLFWGQIRHVLDHQQVLVCFNRSLIF